MCGCVKGTQISLTHFTLRDLIIEEKNWPSLNSLLGFICGKRAMICNQPEVKTFKLLYNVLSLNQALISFKYLENILRR